jgi:hypothetical protein
MYLVKEKGGKPDRKPYPLPYVLRNPHRNLKSEYPKDYAQKPQLYFHEFSFQREFNCPHVCMVSKGTITLHFGERVVCILHL